MSNALFCSILVMAPLWIEFYSFPLGTSAFLTTNSFHPNHHLRCGHYAGTFNDYSQVGLASSSLAVSKTSDNEDVASTTKSEERNVILHSMLDETVLLFNSPQLLSLPSTSSSENEESSSDIIEFRKRELVELITDISSAIQNGPPLNDNPVGEIVIEDMDVATRLDYFVLSQKPLLSDVSLDAPMSLDSDALFQLAKEFIETEGNKEDADATANAASAEKLVPEDIQILRKRLNGLITLLGSHLASPTDNNVIVPPVPPMPEPFTRGPLMERVANIQKPTVSFNHYNDLPIMAVPEIEAEVVTEGSAKEASSIHPIDASEKELVITTDIPSTISSEEEVAIVEESSVILEKEPVLAREENKSYTTEENQDVPPSAEVAETEISSMETLQKDFFQSIQALDESDIPPAIEESASTDDSNAEVVPTVEDMKEKDPLAALQKDFFTSMQTLDKQPVETKDESLDQNLIEEVESKLIPVSKDESYKDLIKIEEEEITSSMSSTVDESKSTEEISSSVTSLQNDISSKIFSSPKVISSERLWGGVPAGKSNKKMNETKDPVKVNSLQKNLSLQPISSADIVTKRRIWGGKPREKTKVTAVDFTLKRSDSDKRMNTETATTAVAPDDAASVQAVELSSDVIDDDGSDDPSTLTAILTTLAVGAAVMTKLPLVASGAVLAPAIAEAVRYYNDGQSKTKLLLSKKGDRKSTQDSSSSGSTTDPETNSNDNSVDAQVSPDGMQQATGDYLSKINETKSDI